MPDHEELFRDLCENADDLIQSVSPEGRFLYVNRAWLRTLGYRREEVSSVTFTDVIHPESLDHCRRMLDELLHGRPVVRVEAIFRAKDGHKVPVEGSATCRFEEGRAVSTRGIFRDVSDRNRARDELDQLFNLSLDLLCIAGTDGFFKQINPAFERVLGYTRDELLSRAFVEFVHPDDREVTIQAVERLAKGLPIVDFQNRYRAKNGRYLWLAWRSAPLVDRGLVYAVARDITESKRIEELMARQAEELSRSNAELEQFAYVASHDLRAPLRGIANLAEWIREDLPEKLPEKVEAHVAKLVRRIHRMERLTDDLLNYSRAGRERDTIEETDTGALVADLAQLLSPPDGFMIVAGPGMPVIETARSALEMVFRNLIGNAIKHHDRPDGKVRVAARRRGKFIEFSVADDGPGIAPKYHKQIFQMFHTLRPRDEVEGTGMGLALVRRLVEKAGGEVTLESEEGKGATFRFTWPARMEIGEEDHAERTGRG